MSIRSRLRAVPVVGSAAMTARRWWAYRTFKGSSDYWDRRYERGGTSGPGSYGRLARYKADFLNSFVSEHGITTVAELGSGDGAQLSLATYMRYVGLDISPTAVEICRARFADDQSKEFRLYEPGAVLPSAELTLSLDVIYHLVEDEIFFGYMRDLFSMAERWVIVYASNEESPAVSPYIRHRRFTDWVATHLPEWTLAQHVPNPFPATPGEDGEDFSFADFHVFRRRDDDLQ